MRRVGRTHHENRDHGYVIDRRERPRGVVSPAALFDVDGGRSIDTLMNRDCLPVAADPPLARVDSVAGFFSFAGIATLFAFLL